MGKNSSIDRAGKMKPFTPVSFEKEEGSVPDLSRGRTGDIPGGGEAKDRLIEKGYEEGFERGLEEGRESMRRAVVRVESILKELEAYRTEKMQELLPEIVDLALEIARKIIKREVSLQRDVVLGIVRDALKKVGTSEHRVTVRVNPEDYEVLVANFAEVKNNGQARYVEVEPSSDISPGGCYIETEGGDVDGRIEEQLKEIEDALRKAHD